MRSTSALLGLCLYGSLSSVLGGPAYEWAGTFDVSKFDSVYWVAQKVDGDYADPAMKIVIMSTAGTGEKYIDDNKDTASGLIDGDTCTTKDGSSAISTSNSGCYSLSFDTSSFETLFEINTAGVDSLTVFAEHFPIEFEWTTHYLISYNGKDVEPVHEWPENESQPYGIVFVACLLVNLMTFAGVAFVALKVDTKNLSPTFQGTILGGAAGALVGCALFLILIEASHLIASQYDADGEAEVEATWRWGTMVLLGYISPMLVFLVQPGQIMNAFVEKDSKTETTAKSTELTTAGGEEVAVGTSDIKTEDDATVSRNNTATMVFAICLGDLMHNMSDGFALGVAYKLCPTTAWGLFGGIIWHEFCQEIADYVLLTSDAIGLSPKWALLWNFLAGTSVILGGMIAVAIDVENGPVGLILAFGGGTYLYLGCTEALPRAMELYKQLDSQDISAVKKHYAAVLGMFCFCCIAVALVLLDHEHCEGGHAH